MRRDSFFALSFISITFLSHRVLSAADFPIAAPPMCRADGFKSQLAAQSIRNFLTSEVRAAAAQTIGLAGMADAPINLVTDEEICVRGAAEMDSLGIAPASNAVYVFRISTSHWVVDPATIPAGFEVGRGFVFDSLWTYKGTITLSGTGG